MKEVSSRNAKQKVQLRKVQSALTKKLLEIIEIFTLKSTDKMKLPPDLQHILSDYFSSIE